MKASTLEQISEKIDYGFTASAATKLDGPRFLRITDIQNGQVDWEHVPGCQCSDLEFERFRIEPGDIVFARTGATTGKSFLIECVPEGGAVFASYLIRLRPRKSVDPSYLAHFFKTPQYWHQISTKSTGSTQPGVNASKLATLSVPLPPLEEQKRIAAILDKADAILRKREQAIKLADDFLRSLFLDMFGDPVSNPKCWPIIELSKLTQIWSGSTPSRDDSLNYGGSIPWVKTTEVDGRTIVDTEEKVTEKGLASARLKLFPPSSIIVALYGQGKTRGRCALLGIHATTNQACGVLMPTDRFHPVFQLVQLSLSYNRLRSLGQGGNQPNLNLGILGSFRVLDPPLQLQRLFASRAAQVNKIARKADDGLAQETIFHDSLRLRAFRGEL